MIWLSDNTISRALPPTDLNYEQHKRIDSWKPRQKQKRKEERPSNLAIHLVNLPRKSQDSPLLAIVLIPFWDHQSPADASLPANPAVDLCFGILLHTSVLLHLQGIEFYQFADGAPFPRNDPRHVLFPAGAPPIFEPSEIEINIENDEAIITTSPIARPIAHRAIHVFEIEAESILRSLRISVDRIFRVFLLEALCRRSLPLTGFCHPKIFVAIIVSMCPAKIARHSCQKSS